eukprot:jgi/Psemu1/27918/gm1.27918_g
MRTYRTYSSYLGLTQGNNKHLSKAPPNDAVPASSPDNDSQLAATKVHDRSPPAKKRHQSPPPSKVSLPVISQEVIPEAAATKLDASSLKPNKGQNGVQAAMKVYAVSQRAKNRHGLKPTSVSPHGPPPSTSTKQEASVPNTHQEDVDYREYQNSAENHLQSALHEKEKKKKNEKLLSALGPILHQVDVMANLFLFKTDNGVTGKLADYEMKTKWKNFQHLLWYVHGGRQKYMTVYREILVWHMENVQYPPPSPNTTRLYVSIPNAMTALYTNQEKDIAVDDLFDNRCKALAEKVFEAPHPGSFCLEDVMENIEDLVLKEQRYLAQSNFLHQRILMEQIPYVIREIFVTGSEVLCNKRVHEWLSKLTLLAKKLVEQEEDLLKVNLEVAFLSKMEAHNTKGNDLYLSGVFKHLKGSNFLCAYKYEDDAAKGFCYLPESGKICTWLTPSLAKKLVEQEEDLLKVNLEVAFLSKMEAHNTKGNDLYLSGVFKHLKGSNFLCTYKYKDDAAKGLVLPWLVGRKNNNEVHAKTNTSNDEADRNTLLPPDDYGKLPEDKGTKGDEGNMDKNGNGSADNKDANSENDGDLKPAAKKTTSKEPGRKTIEGNLEIMPKRWMERQKATHYFPIVMMSDDGHIDKNGNGNADNKDANSKNNSDLKPATKKKETQKKWGRKTIQRNLEIMTKQSVESHHWSRILNWLPKIECRSSHYQNMVMFKDPDLEILVLYPTYQVGEAVYVGDKSHIGSVYNYVSKPYECYDAYPGYKLLFQAEDGTGKVQHNNKWNSSCGSSSASTPSLGKVYSNFSSDSNNMSDHNKGSEYDQDDNYPFIGSYAYSRTNGSFLRGRMKVLTLSDFKSDLIFLFLVKNWLRKHFVPGPYLVFWLSYWQLKLHYTCFFSSIRTNSKFLITMGKNYDRPLHSTNPGSKHIAVTVINRATIQ